LKRALSDRLLPLLVAAMVFLAALAVGGMAGSSALARHWRDGAASELTVQLADRSSAGNFSGIAGVASVERLDDAKLGALLRPWLGVDAASLSLPLPAVFDVHLSAGANMANVLRDVQARMPDAVIEQNGAWLSRLSALGRSLEACAALALLLVMLIGLALVMIATRAGLAARRDAIEIVHALGAEDGMIAAAFARRIAVLTFFGGVIGVACAVPVLLALAQLAAPFSAQQVILDDAAAVARSLPAMVWGSLPGLTVAAGGLGFVTAYVTVRVWLARLP